MPGLFATGDHWHALASLDLALYSSHAAPANSLRSVGFWSAMTTATQGLSGERISACHSMVLGVPRFIEVSVLAWLHDGVHLACEQGEFGRLEPK